MQLDSVASAFIEAIAPLVHSHLHSMPPPLQILIVGCAAVIIAAKAFWMQPSDARASHVIASTDDYIQSCTVEDVKAAILEALQDTDELGHATLLQVVLNNQI
ncbi:hypothetical protein BOTBODRAFT_332648 [Botryobasidium botryosum FD-172 SS1]|uniref:Uncharacterized protein n=1 Tax=Botryobasidium botryosum (strain FD-172 SS1) TaxID=930990 RepID=A0A067MHB4_BOTB1|nr:hypothetical protein BOTBODRAFT_332648 [Botryobasidium botryosum FD-172 SS1]